MLNRLKELFLEKIPLERLEESVKKILMAKYKVGLNKLKRVENTNIVNEMNEEADLALLDKIASEAITLVKNENQNLPFKNLSDKKVGYLKLGDDNNAVFLNFLNKYQSVAEINIDDNFDFNILSDYDKIIIGFHKSDKSPFGEFRFKKNEIGIIEKVKKLTELVLVVFAKPNAFLI